MPFKVIFLLCVALLVSGCLSTTTDVRHFDCQMTGRFIEDKKATTEKIEEFLPSKFKLKLASSHAAIIKENQILELEVSFKSAEKLNANVDVDSKHSNGDAFPMTYELSFDLLTKQYLLKARPYKLMAFGQQTGICF